MIVADSAAVDVAVDANVADGDAAVDVCCWGGVAYVAAIDAAVAAFDC